MYAGTCNRGIFAGLAAFGAIDFNADLVWQDWLAGAGGNQAAGMRAANSIRAALAQLGYGTVSMSASWGTSQDKAAYSKFVSQQGVAPSPNGSWWPTKPGVLRLGQLVAAGGTPGGGPSIDYQVIDGEFVQQGGPKGAGIPMWAALGAVGVAAFLIIRGKQRKGGEPSPSRYAAV